MFQGAIYVYILYMLEYSSQQSVSKCRFWRGPSSIYYVYIYILIFCLVYWILYVYIYINSNMYMFFLITGGSGGSSTSAEILDLPRTLDSLAPLCLGLPSCTRWRWNHRCPSRTGVIFQPLLGDTDETMINIDHHFFVGRGGSKIWDTYWPTGYLNCGFPIWSISQHFVPLSKVLKPGRGGGWKRLLEAVYNSNVVNPTNLKFGKAYPIKFW